MTLGLLVDQFLRMCILVAKVSFFADFLVCSGCGNRLFRHTSIFIHQHFKPLVSFGLKRGSFRFLDLGCFSTGLLRSCLGCRACMAKSSEVGRRTSIMAG